MTEQATPALAARVETIKNSVHITGAISASLSTDREYGMIVFMVSSGEPGKPDERFAITIRADQVDGLRAVVARLMMQVMQSRREGDVMGKVLLESRNPAGGEDVLVGEVLPEDAERNKITPCVVLTLCPGKTDETSYRIGHATAAKLASLLDRKALPKLTAEERAEFKTWSQNMDAAVTMPQQIITPDGKVFDVPGVS